MDDAKFSKCVSNVIARLKRDHRKGRLVSTTSGHGENDESEEERKSDEEEGRSDEEEAVITKMSLTLVKRSMAYKQRRQGSHEKNE